VEAIYRLAQEPPGASLALLGKRLGIGTEDAAGRLLALQGLGLVRSGGGGRLALTGDGELVALGLVRKHRLLERLLADHLKLPWERVHEDACRLSPVLSDEAADGLARWLGEPASCPHGNPIPGADGTIVAETATPLHRLRPGQSGTILRIEREEPEVLRYLAVLGLLPGIDVEVEEVAPLGGPIIVRTGASRYALGRKVASRILVRRAG
jgi:DtxR family Mn-dependent transcriptional regulator